MIKPIPSVRKFVVGVVVSLTLMPSLAVEQTLQLDHRLNERIVLIPAGKTGKAMMETTVFRPNGPGPYPLLKFVAEQGSGKTTLTKVLKALFDPDVAPVSSAPKNELDLVIGNWAQPPDHLPNALLFEDEVVCLVDRAHRCASKIALDDYLQGSHVVPMLSNMPQGGVIDMALEERGMSRHTTVTVPYFSMGPQLLPGTDLIFTTSRHFAEHYAAILPLAVVPPPVDFAPMRFCQLWHPRTQYSAPHLWLRSLLSAVVRTAHVTQHTRMQSMSLRPHEMRRRVGDRRD